MKTRAPVVLIVIALLFAERQTARPSPPRQLSLTERVAYQYAIEEVYWRHRIWPKENPRPKPSLDAVMSPAQIEKKVNDYLRNSQLLAERWRRPMTPEGLQSEMERIARDTKRPDMLREIFAALGNDPLVIAECLARPILAQRFVTELTAHKSSEARQVSTAVKTDNSAYTLPQISVPVDCADDTWTATSLTNAPTAREYHTAIWTGSEMIVWGGTNGSAYFNNGGRYDPATDSWDAMAVSSAITPREYHTAVWTGSEMIVWGGLSCGSATCTLNTGGRYSPSTDSWTATSTTNAPSSRFDHTAVFTGSEMIVWSGDFWNGTSYVFLNTGGRYNPSTDSWTATSTTNAPAGRRYHTAVWAGGLMIVWGGYAGGPSYFTGGRYSPTIDSWTATATNAPAGRYRHTAVWTDSEMIVWGGETSNLVLSNTGGRYCARLAQAVVTSASSRKAHGFVGEFDIDLSGAPGIECRAGGTTNDYKMVVTFSGLVVINGNPQAAVTAGVGSVGSDGNPNGGMISVSGNTVTVPLTNVANAQTISVTLFGVNGTSNFVIPMSILVGDVNGTGAVNAGDIVGAKSRIGQPVNATNFRADVNASGAINATDVSIVKSYTGTGLP